MLIAKEYSNFPLGIHTHNNFNLALLNSLKAIQEGANMLIQQFVEWEGQGMLVQKNLF